jgi:hypothetical protein
MCAALTSIVVVVAARGRVARGLEPGVPAPCTRTIRPVAKLLLCTMVHPLDIRLNKRFDGYSIALNRPYDRRKDEQSTDYTQSTCTAISGLDLERVGPFDLRSHS